MRAWAKAALLAVLSTAATAVWAQTADLVSESAFRVCADPASLPSSNEAGEGYENRIAELLAGELGLPLEYTWYPQATGFVRKTLMDAKCDVIIGYAQGHEMVLNTNHWMTSAYVLMTRPDSDLADVTTLADERLKGRAIGVVAGSPPATHMARNGLIGTARPYQLTVDTRYDNPVKQMIDDLRAGEIDAAAVWGPIGGWYAKEGEPLNVQPLLSEQFPPRMFYRITMGVRQGETVWKRKLNSLIRRNQDRIDAILRDYGVPMVTDMGDALKP